MFVLNLKSREVYDEHTNSFHIIEGGTFHLEHSLYAISKWEQKYKIPFLHSNVSGEKFAYYITCMTEEEINPLLLTKESMLEVVDYIKDPQTATSFSKSREPDSRDILTSEMIYAIMAMAGLDISWEKRNFNRLLVVLRIISIKNDPKNKMAMNEIYRSNSELNAMRKARLGTSG